MADPNTPPPPPPPVPDPPWHPVDPRRPRAALSLLLTALLLAACTPPAGTVTSKSISIRSDDRLAHYNLCTKSTPDAAPQCGEVDHAVWDSCRVGDRYSQGRCVGREPTRRP